jgi:RHH-type proline utilization regulon transcriptional repressor/proline dehydrogenase/delta 1-pyrroline-5-carboxylate dehydrogenase
MMDTDPNMDTAKPHFGYITEFKEKVNLKNELILLGVVQNLKL